MILSLIFCTELKISGNIGKKELINKNQYAKNSTGIPWSYFGFDSRPPQENKYHHRSVVILQVEGLAFNMYKTNLWSLSICKRHIYGVLQYTKTHL